MAKQEGGLREVSPEEYRRMKESSAAQPAASSMSTSATPRADYSTGHNPYETPRFLRTPQWPKTILGMAVVVACLLIGFAAGMNYQKHHSGSVAATRNGAANGFGQGGFGGRGFRRSGGLGTVTAVSDSSITIQNSRTGSNQTFKITSSTTITNNGASASVSDIQNGDTVLIRTSATDTSTATAIDINPSFGGAGGPMSSPTDTPDSSSGSSTPSQST